MICDKCGKIEGKHVMGDSVYAKPFHVCKSCLHEWVRIWEDNDCPRKAKWMRLFEEWIGKTIVKEKVVFT